MQTQTISPVDIRHIIAALINVPDDKLYMVYEVVKRLSVTDATLAQTSNGQNKRIKIAAITSALQAHPTHGQLGRALMQGRIEERARG